MIPTYGGVLSAIEKALRKLVEEYQRVGKSLRDLVEGQERNTAQLERIGAAIEWRWGLEEECQDHQRWTLFLFSLYFIFSFSLSFILFFYF